MADEQQHQHDPLWLFRLDELDLLEFEFNALRHASDVDDPKMQKVEEQILDEQDAIESEAQAELDVLIGDMPMHDSCPVHDVDELATPMEQLLVSSVQSDPLASHAMRFVRPLSDWASKATVDARTHEPLFRIRADAPLIPAKLTFAAHEERQNDEVALYIAEKELDLASTYLTRVLTSIETLGKEEAMPQAKARDMLQDGEGLLRDVQSKLKRVRTGLRFRPSRP